MVSAPRPWMARIPRSVRAAGRRVRLAITRRLTTGNRRVALVLAVVTLVIGFAAAHVSDYLFSPGLMVLPILAGGLLLWPRALRILFGVVALMLAYDAVMGRAGPGIIVTIAITALFADVFARTRGKIGVLGLRGDRLLIELRDRIRAQSAMPALPGEWGSASVLRPAGGASFGGDFIVSACDGKALELAVVDVSGKGLDAGNRALILSGAFGGLLGSVPRGDFLPLCNDYLRRGPTEGFVTAVHLWLDLATGEYVISSAGHPPAVHYDAASGAWEITRARGIVLGVVPDLGCVPEDGLLRHGDALMLYTDGLVEVPGRDIDTGIDRLLGAGDALVASGFSGGADALVRSMHTRSSASDDCALVLIWRS